MTKKPIGFEQEIIMVMACKYDDLPFSSFVVKNWGKLWMIHPQDWMTKSNEYFIASSTPA